MHRSLRLSSLSLLGCCLLAATSSSVLAQDAAKPAAPAVGTQVSPAATYGKLLTGMEKQFVEAADAMPEDKFNFAPPATAGDFKDARTFAGQVKHVAEANYYFFGGPNFSEADGKAMSESIDKMTSKADIMKDRKSVV